MPRVSGDGKITKFIMKKDLVSLLNAVFGFFAIISFSLGNLERGLVMLVIALVMDGLDGEIARSFFTTTEFGKRMDMADLVSFGAAPALFIIVWLSPDTAMEVFLLNAAALTLLSAELFRLARFQTRESEESYFLGLPGTVTGVIYPILYLMNVGLYSTVVVTFIISAFMVSSLKLPIKPKRLR